MDRPPNSRHECIVFLFSFLGDANGDKVIRTDQPMFVAWAVGNINPSGLVAKHTRRTIGKNY